MVDHLTGLQWIDPVCSRSHSEEPGIHLSQLDSGTKTPAGAPAFAIRAGSDALGRFDRAGAPERAALIEEEHSAAVRIVSPLSPTRARAAAAAFTDWRLRAGRRHNVRRSVAGPELATCRNRRRASGVAATGPPRGWKARVRP